MLEFPDRAGSVVALRCAATSMLPSAYCYRVGTPEFTFSRLDSPACTSPYRRLASVLTNGHPRLGVEMVRYSFLVRLLHPLRLPSFSWRFSSPW
jgi:hypothetical protein